MDWIKAFHVDKNIIYEKKNLKKKIWEIENFFCYLISPILSLFGHNFCSRAPIMKKIIFPWSYSVFLSSKKVPENHNINSNRRYLPKIPFVHSMDNGLLGFKLYIAYDFQISLTNFSLFRGILNNLAFWLGIFRNNIRN